MKILVTGVAGFLGSHLAEKLSELNHKVIGVDNMSGGYKDNIPKIFSNINSFSANLKILVKKSNSNNSVRDNAFFSLLGEYNLMKHFTIGVHSNYNIYSDDKKLAINNSSIFNKIDSSCSFKIIPLTLRGFPNFTSSTFKLIK